MKRSSIIAFVGAVTAVVAVAAATGVACSSMMQAPESQVPLASCATGWYTDAPVQTCADRCLDPKPPECSAADCQTFGVEGYLSNGALVDMVLFYSPTTKTMSTFTDYTKRQYELGTGQIRMTPPGKWGAAQCYIGTAGNRIVLAGYASYFRAAPGLASALDKQYASGATHWTGAPAP